ncbi:E3 ubiquitin-protein ligase RNF6-like [Megalops cyprinoides]|uniref:E3 ubiquitin-protein ligase RNF6-like n=1 Tax=Megalops cyprinoides TaxID=118141 RepID=UPI0018651908|nr:E3 ubiquitin-protein ligase RNF6-like [Megalops cyprinoides]
MDTPGGRDERVQQRERLQREEAYYHFINGLSEEEYRLMRDSNLLGTPGEVTAEELRQRLDGAKERLLAQPPREPHPQSSDPQEENRGRGGVDVGGEASNGDTLLEWLNTFRRTGNATRSGQSGNQTWRAVSRTNPNSGEFRFSLEININHEQPEVVDAIDPPLPGPRIDPAHASQGRRPQVRRTRSSTATPPVRPDIPAGRVFGLRRGVEAGSTSLTALSQPAQSSGRRGRSQGAEQEWDSDGLDCPRSSHHSSTLEQPRSRTRARGRRGGRGGRGGASRRSRSPLHRMTDAHQSPEPGTTQSSRPDAPQPSEISTSAHSDGLSAALSQESSVLEAAMETGEATNEPGQDTSALPAPVTSPEPTAVPVPGTAPDAPALPPSGTDPEAGAEQVEAQASSPGGSGRRHPTIMLDLQVRRIRPGENRDRDSIASRTRSRVRTTENTVTFESDSGGFRRTISRSERAGIRTYVSTIRIPLRRISETGLGEPSSTALRSILRQIMTGFGELSSLMETEADSDAAAAATATATAPSPETSPTGQALGVRGDEDGASREVPERRSPEEERLVAGEAERAWAGVPPGEGRTAGRDTNNLVENGTLPILRLAHFFLLNDDEDEEHQRGLTKEQIDNLSTRTYGQASLEGEVGRACSVCINEYAQGNKLRRLPCTHEFHIHCIDRWLSENNTCPICRQPILSSHLE